MTERLYTVKETKKLLGVTTWTIQQWDRQGKIDALELSVEGEEFLRVR
jgi:hypothetical protein